MYEENNRKTIYVVRFIDMVTLLKQWFKFFFVQFFTNISLKNYLLKLLEQKKKRKMLILDLYFS